MCVRRSVDCLASVLLVSTLGSSVADADLLGPTPYLSFADSPFNGFGSPFYLEDFEDHLFNAPGVTANAGGVASHTFGPGSHDSVDFDDGTIDGSGLGGDDYFSGSGPVGIAFSFDADVLGSLPSRVGIVWTDGRGAITFEAFDQNGQSLGTLHGIHADESVEGETGEDRFYGATNTAGISRIFIANEGGGIEVDHLQYDRTAVPEPHALTLFALAYLPVGLAHRRRRPQPSRPFRT